MANWFKNKMLTVALRQHKKDLEKVVTPLQYISNEELDGINNLVSSFAQTFKAHNHYDLYDPFNISEKYPEAFAKLIDIYHDAKKRGDVQSVTSTIFWVSTAMSISGIELYPDLFALTKQMWRELNRNGGIKIPKGFEA